jgi:hypothetical protein
MFQNKIPVYSTTMQELNMNTSFGNLFAMFHIINTQMMAPHILITKKLLSVTRVRKKGFPSRPNPLLIRNWLMSPSATTSDNNVPKRYSTLRRLTKESMIKYEITADTIVSSYWQPIPDW